MAGRVMTGVLVLPGSAPEAEWLAARRQGITASEVPVLMGLTSWGSPYELYHRKTGTLPEEPDNDAMAIGRHMESYVAARFADRHPEFVLHGTGRELYAHPERPWQLATPDRLCQEGPGGVSRHLVAVLECKVDNSDGWGEDGTDEIPVRYRAQVLWQMDVLGVRSGFVACLLWFRRQVRVYELAMDGQAEADLKLMRAEAEAFLERLARKDPPEIDWRPATTDALKRLHPSVENTRALIRPRTVIQYRSAVKAYKLAEKRKRLAENRLRQLMGTSRYAEGLIDGEVFARRDVYELPEKIITRKASVTDRLVPVNPKGQPQ